jgi:hypothetical protein
MGDHATYFVLPVMGMEPGETRRTSKPRQVCGTAFSIGGGVYLTAGHVWKQAQKHPLQALGMMNEPESREVLAVAIKEAELLEAVDLAVLKASPFGKSFSWSFARSALFDGVRTYGYPYGLDSETDTLNIRAFQGTIVGGAPIAALPARPHGTEVSFPCPRGLSGAPLIRHDPKPEQIIGVVLGNTVTDMEIYRETETLKENGGERILIKTESLHLGIAIRADVVVSLASSLLGSTIGDWLGRHRLLAE